VIAGRKNKFEHFISSTKKITAGLIHDFHNTNHGDDENGFIINRETGMKTFSITQAIISSNQIDFIHTDLLQHQQYEEILHINL
jgi:hypothetical protein